MLILQENAENKNILINIIIDFMKDLIMIIQNLLIIKINFSKQLLKLDL